MDDEEEYRLRRKAMSLRLKGTAYHVVLAIVHRSRGWLSKWEKRFEQQGVSGLHSHSRRPHRAPAMYSTRMVQSIIQTRRRLTRQKVGLIGARAIRRELRRVSAGKGLPSLSTIKRVLQTRHLTDRPSKMNSGTYFPKPLTVLSGTLQALDWTCRYLEDGLKVYAFHTLNLRTRACAQTIATDKRGETVRAHCLHAWITLGIPQFLQLDNDAAFCGGYKAPRIFGQFVRLCLCLGIQLIFLPVGQPQCNGEVEELNGLWGHAFWERRHFSSFAQVCRTSPIFIQWYLTDYVPPFLGDATPQEAQQHEPLHHLTARQIRQLPDPLPITDGKIHFIRQVEADGTISILNESWKVGKRWAGKYVWATLITHCRRLEIWYQSSAQHDWRLLHKYPYDISETVAHFNPDLACHRST